MCGIAGILTKNKITDSSKDTLNKILKSLHHRGPDSEGIYQSDKLILGTTRLSIIDIEGGTQPLYNEDYTIALVANGEVYNFKELRTELELKGHIFKTKSDCEVIIHSYEEYGVDFVQKLRGMYAFALYDKNINYLYIVRDRMGEKPLYFFKSSDSFIFASEMKSLLSSKLIPFKLNHKAIFDFFHFQFIPEPQTAIENVHKLEAGNLIKIDMNTWNFNFIKYWDMLESPVINSDPDIEITRILDEIGNLTIRSDVKIGVALSGGLDSSAIAALAKKFSKEQIVAFSVGYPGKPSYDEREEAKYLANKLDIPIIEVELDIEDLVRNFAKMNFYRDDPIADISGFGYYAVSRSAKQNRVKVLLQGQGGDEIFWGYEWVKNAVDKTENSRNRKSSLRQFLTNWKKNLPKKNTKDFLTWIFSFTRIRGSLRQIKKYDNPINRCVFYELTPDYKYTHSNRNRLFSKSTQSQFQEYSPLDRFSIDKSISSDLLIMKYISQSYLLENGIAQGDRLSMANSIELRLPLVDYRLVETLVGIRKNKDLFPDYKNFPKPYLRKAMKNILPKEVIERPKKGFSPPVHKWHEELFKNFGHELKNGILANSGFLSKEGLDECLSGTFPDGTVAPFSFKALVLENWARQMKELTI